KRPHLGGKPGGHKSGEQGGRGGPLQPKGGRRPAPKPAAEGPAGTASRSAGCGAGRRRSSACTRNIGSISIESGSDEPWVFATTNRPAPGAATRRSATLPT